MSQDYQKTRERDRNEKVREMEWQRTPQEFFVDIDTVSNH